MKRTEYRTQNPDGSVTIETHGPVSRAWRAGRVVWALIFLLTALIAAIEAQWDTSGFALLVGAIILPTMRKHPA